MKKLIIICLLFAALPVRGYYKNPVIIVSKPGEMHYFIYLSPNISVSSPASGSRHCGTPRTPSCEVWLQNLNLSIQLKEIEKQLLAIQSKVNDLNQIP